jgi:hypothetical protein
MKGHGRLRGVSSASSVAAVLVALLLPGSAAAFEPLAAMGGGGGLVLPLGVALDGAGGVYSNPRGGTVSTRSTESPRLGALTVVCSGGARGSRSRCDVGSYSVVAPKALAASSTARAAVAFRRSRIGLTSTTSRQLSSPDSATSSIARCASR